MMESILRGKTRGSTIANGPCNALCQLKFCQLLHELAIQRVQALADISRSAVYEFAVYKLTYVHVVIATKPVHRLQICPIVHNYRAPLPFPQVTSGSVQ